MLINLLSFDNLNVVVTVLFIAKRTWPDLLALACRTVSMILSYHIMTPKNLTEINGDNIIPESCHSICRNILAIKTSHCVPFPSRGSLTFL